MARQFDGTGLAPDAAGAYAKPGRLELLFIVFVHAIVAVVLLGVIFAAAQACPGQNLQPFLTRGLGPPSRRLGKLQESGVAT